LRSLVSNRFSRRATVLVEVCVLLSGFSAAQVSVTTYHNNKLRTGSNILETTLTPSNVNSAHFGKLFAQVRPDFAMFGEKDYQQLRVVARMARDLDLGVKVVGSQTVRERDGLAMSSRNVYLSPDERLAAPVLYRAMKESVRRLRAGDDVAAAMADGAKMIVAAGFALDYFEVRHAESLAPIASANDGPMRILVAARLGTTRLIDNIAV